MKVADIAITISSTANERLEFVASILPEPARNTVAVCTSVYIEFMPRRHGVTIRLLIIDWNMREALPTAKAAISITTRVGTRKDKI